MEGWDDKGQKSELSPQFVQILVRNSPPAVTHYLDVQMRLLAESQTHPAPRAPTVLQNRDAQNIRWDEWLHRKISDEVVSNRDNNQADLALEHRDGLTVYIQMEQAFRYQREFDLDIEYTRSLREELEAYY